MKEHPILFSGPMIRAILDGRKTMTRRVVKPTMTTPRIAPLRMEPWLIDGEQETDDNGVPLWAGFHPDYPGEAKWFGCPYGQPGDRLWVRETWLQDNRITRYRADGVNAPPQQWDFPGAVWRPSIHMPRWASRLTLEITGVKVERLQDISEEDAIAEGAIATNAGDGYPFAMPARMNFVDLWDDINAKRGQGWADDPWVWAITFKRIEP